MRQRTAPGEGELDEAESENAESENAESGEAETASTTAVSAGAAHVRAALSFRSAMMEGWQPTRGKITLSTFAALRGRSPSRSASTQPARRGR